MPRNTYLSQTLLFILPILTGVLLACACPSLGFSHTVWFALIPLGLCFAAPEVSRSHYIGVYFGGLLFGLALFLWLPTCNYQGDTWGPFTLAWLMAGHLGGTLFLVMVRFGRRYVQWSRWPMALCLPVIWMGFDFLCSAIAWLLCQCDIPFVQLGLTAADQLTIVQIADLVGVPGLTMFIAAVNGALCDLVLLIVDRVSRRRQTSAIRLAPASIVGVLMLLALGYGTWRLQYQSSAAGPTVCLMSEVDLPPFGKGHPLATDDTVADLLVWSEEVYHHPIVDGATMQLTRTSSASVYQEGRPNETPQALASTEPLVANEPTAQTALSQAARESGAALLIGCRRISTPNNNTRQSAIYNSLAYATPDKGYVGHFDKRRLVPWTEYTPYVNATNSPLQEGTFAPGEVSNPFSIRAASSGKEFRFSCAVCYDVCYPEVFRFGKTRGENNWPIDFYVQSGSEKIDRSGVLPKIMLNMTRLRAIEFRRPIVRNGSGGASGIVDGNGRLSEMQTSGGEELSYEIASVPLDTRRTLYSWAGNIPVFTLWAFLLGMPYFSRSKSKSQ